MGRDRKEMPQVPWRLQTQSPYADAPHAAGTGVIMAGTAVIALPRGDISSITAGIEIFVGSTICGPWPYAALRTAPLRRRRPIDT